MVPTASVRSTATWRRRSATSTPRRRPAAPGLCALQDLRSGDAPRLPRVDTGARRPRTAASPHQQAHRNHRPRLRIDEAVDTLRDDLAEIGVMLKDAMPPGDRGAGDRGALARATPRHTRRAAAAPAPGVERGLAENHDVLRALTPAGNLVGLDDAVKGLSQKIDLIGKSSQGSRTRRAARGAIAALRGIVTHVASNDALAKLSDEVQVDHQSRPGASSAGSGADVLSTLEQRISVIADALQSRTKPARMRATSMPWSRAGRQARTPATHARRPGRGRPSRGPDCQAGREARRLRRALEPSRSDRARARRALDPS